MMQITDEELEVLLDKGESDRVEYKQSWKGDAPKKGRQAICAFANDLPDHQRPGVLFVGAKDDGSPSGLEITDGLLLTLSDIRRDGNILPLPSIVVEKRTLKGAEVAVVIVQPSYSPPVRYKGRIWVRTGPGGTQASPQEERILNEKRRYRDISFDVQPLPSCDLSMLSRVMFEQEYLPLAVARDILAANQRSYEQKLASCRMTASVDDPTPTVLGLLVLGLSPRDWLPGAYIQFLRIAGTEITDDIQDAADIDGALGQVLRRIDEKLEAHNRTEVDIKSSNQEVRTSPYPRVALQQLIRNAVMHRTYENTNAPVRVYWFDDRIEIISPGGPYGAVTKENFGKGVTDYRNPNLAEAMKVMGFVQRFGIGIQLARKELQKNGNPDIEFNVESTTVLAVVRRRA